MLKGELELSDGQCPPRSTTATALAARAAAALGFNRTLQLHKRHVSVERASGGALGSAVVWDDLAVIWRFAAGGRGRARVGSEGLFVVCRPGGGPTLAFPSSSGRLSCCG